jgi:hypothetical protein
MDDQLTSDQRDALDALKASRGACPSAETLVDYSELSAGDRARHPAHDHIAICSRCQLVLLHTGSETVVSASRVRWFLPLAAAVVLAIGATVIWRAGALAPAVPAESVRGTEIQPVAPIGSVDAVSEFSWQSPIRAERYRLKVMRGSEQVWTVETNGLRITAPAGLFDANVEYRWTVEAIDREGDIRMTSRAQSFIRRAP